MIATAEEVEQSITFVSKIIEMMRLHSELHNIEFIYRGFGSTLNEFEKKLNTLNSNFVMAIEKNSIEDYNDINLKILCKFISINIICVKLMNI